MGVHAVSHFDISVVAIGILVMSGLTSAAGYKYTDLGPGKAYDINNNGHVVGTDGVNAVIWHNTAKTVVGADIARGINNSGQVVGATSDGAVLWNGGTSTTLPDFEKESGYKVTAAKP
jgi:hypothetical protein